MSSELRVMPHNLEAEKSVLGAVLVNNAALATVLPVIQATDFFRAAHAQIFDRMVVLQSRGEPVDLVTLKDDLQRHGVLDEVGGPAYIAHLTDGIPRSTNAASYARIVKDMSRLRAIVLTGIRIVEDAYAATTHSSELLVNAVAELSALMSFERDAPTDIGKTVEDYVTSVSSGDLPEPMPTGLADIDSLLQGIRRKELVIVAARPSTGKTAYMLGLAENLAANGYPVVVFSLEVARERLAAQLLSWRSNVTVVDMESGTADEHEYARVISAAQTFSELPIVIDDSSRTIPEVLGWCRRLKSERDIKAVFIDYLQLLSLGQRTENRQMEVASISRALKLMAKDLDVAVVALAQLGRASESRRDKRPQSSDLRESGALEQDADVIKLLFRPEMYTTKPEHEGMAEVIVAKNRHGATGVLRTAFVKRIAKFANLSREGDDV